jgi:hypothetical protein
VVYKRAINENKKKTEQTVYRFKAASGCINTRFLVSTMLPNALIFRTAIKCTDVWLDIFYF